MRALGLTLLRPPTPLLHAPKPYNVMLKMYFKAEDLLILWSGEFLIKAAHKESVKKQG